MPDNLLIIGSGSYVGRHLVDHCRGREVAVAGVSSKDCDLRDSGQVEALLARPEYQGCPLVLCAVVNKYVRNDYQAFLDNVAMVRNLTTFARPSHMVYLSAVDVYGAHPPLPVTEDTRPNPSDWYSLAKFTSEQVLTEVKRPDCPVCVLRLPGIFGVGHGERSVVGRFASAIREGETVRISGDGTALRDFVWVQDLCRLILKAVTGSVEGVLNVATGTSIPILRIAEMLGETLGATPNIQFDEPDSLRNFDLEFETTRLGRSLSGFSFSAITTGLQTYAKPAEN